MSSVTSYDLGRPLVTIFALLVGCSPDLSLLSDDVSFGGVDAGGDASTGQGGAGESDAGKGGVATDVGGDDAGGAGSDPMPIGGEGPLPPLGGAGAGGASLGGAGPVCAPSGAEICNAEDDDCNGVVDEGCPTVTTTFEQALPALGDSPGGGAFADDCKHGEVLGGVIVRMGSFLAQVQGICRRLELVTSSSAPHGYALQLTTVAPLAPHPAAGTDTLTTLACPENEALVGLKVSQQHVTLANEAMTTVIPRVWASCAKLVLVERQDKSLGVDWTGLKELAPASGSIANGTAWFASAAAPQGLVATRLHGTSGSWIDRLGFGVGRLDVVQP